MVIKGSGQVKDIKLKAISTYHDESHGAERGANTVFVFTVDGINMCVVGDLGHQLSSKQTKLLVLYTCS